MSSVLPASVPLSLWEEFRKMRKKKRAPLTEYAETLILCKLEKWRIENQADVIAILEESIERSWSGVFLNGHGKTPDGQATGSSTEMILGRNKDADVRKSPKPDLCCICKRPLNGSFIYCSGGKRCHGCF
jgi:hypothetical protein